MVAAASAHDVAMTIQKEFGSGSLRLYTNDDVAGVELGGSLKNVIALAAGVVNGLGSWVQLCRCSDYARDC